MKKRKALPPQEIAAGFTRGFVATTLLTALQDRGGAPLDTRKILRYGLQGGAALAAGTAAADALGRGKYAEALVGALGGAAGVMAIEYLLNPPGAADDEEKTLGQEEA